MFLNNNFNLHMSYCLGLWCYTLLLSLHTTLPEKNITLKSEMHSFIFRFSLKFTVIKLISNTTQMKPSVNRG